MENLILLTVFIFCLCLVFTVGALCEIIFTSRSHAKHSKLNGFFDYKL
jgi:hypothetical protein